MQREDGTKCTAKPDSLMDKLSCDILQKTFWEDVYEALDRVPVSEDANPILHILIPLTEQREASRMP